MDDILVATNAARGALKALKPLLDLASVLDEATNLQTAVNDLQTQQGKLTQAIATLAQQKDQAAQDTAKAQTEADAAIKVHQERTASAIAAVNDRLNKASDALEQETANLKQRTQEMAAAEDQHRKTLADLKNQIAAAQMELNQVQAQYAAFKASLPK